MSTYFTKTRKFRYAGLTGVRTAVHYDTNQVFENVVTPTEAGGDQTTWSRDRLFPRWMRLRARVKARGQSLPITRSRGDLGGSFTTIKRTYSDNGCLTDRITMNPIRWVSTVYGYSGPIMALNPRAGTSGLDNYPNFSELSLQQEMIQMGSTAISRTIPTNPMAGAGQLIGESVQQLPKLPGMALLGRTGNVSKKFADEYLNLEFGVKPIIADAQDIAKSVRNANRILEQLERDSGRLVRRRYHFPVERTIETRVNEARTQSYPGLNTRQYGGAGIYTVRRETVKRMWFSGAYTYHYQQGQDLWDKLRRAEQHGNKLFGLRLSPSLVWELSPWSWAADWVTNAGDVISNLSAFSRDGLVLNWGYIMCDLRITDTHTLRVNLADGQVIRPVQTFTTHVKKRLPATPYGFGLDPDWYDLSSRQLAILGALGISRVR